MYSSLFWQIDEWRGAECGVGETTVAIGVSPPRGVSFFLLKSKPPEGNQDTGGVCLFFSPLSPGESTPGGLFNISKLWPTHRDSSEWRFFWISSSVEIRK